MKLSLVLLVVVAGSSASAFAPSALSSVSTPQTAMFATVEGTKLIPPKKVEDLADSAQDLYAQNVQTTYG